MTWVKVVIRSKLPVVKINKSLGCNAQYGDNSKGKTEENEEKQKKNKNKKRKKKEKEEHPIMPAA